VLIVGPPPLRGHTLPFRRAASRWNTDGAGSLAWTSLPTRWVPASGGAR